jgi:hypothetical protein
MPINWNNSASKPFGRGPLVGSKRRSQGLSVWSWLLVLGAGAGLYLLSTVVAPDLERAAHIAAKHADDGPAKPVPGKGPVERSPQALAYVGNLPPGGTTAEVNHKPEVGLDPVAQALLHGARDAVSRKLSPVWHLVEDSKATSASHFDLLDRSLSEHIPLRNALLRHRIRQPERYGLKDRPPTTLEERRRALTTPNLLTLLSYFSERVELASGLQAGDIAVLERKKGRKVLTGIVSDVVGAGDKPLVLVLDPAFREAKEVAMDGDYRLLQVLRLHSAQVQKMRDVLDLNSGGVAQPGVRL